ncbi:ribbon-helix-helix domain-containing protein [Paraglaciecola sp.]|uniref:ribbon-helix-helix domain-containing protein n=1 Tax=Paraglaciecola sp. TaxID=1920173 RepID=UPI0030F49462
MSLSSLKKSAPSAEIKVLTVDEFIQGAEYYACGLKLVAAQEIQIMSDRPLKRATFTLGKVAIAKLDALSAQTGLAKSRLIRQWLDNQGTH